jgi:hypothetical protein
MVRISQSNKKRAVPRKQEPPLLDLRRIYMHNQTLRILVALVVGFIFASCATTGENYAAEAAQGADVFSGKNWNAPRRNNMYDRWEFNTDGTFHFWHVHHGEPLDRGVYRYQLSDGTITITKEGEHEGSAYTYTFKGRTVTLAPVHHGGAEHAPAGGHEMGALPEDTATFTHAK